MNITAKILERKAFLESLIKSLQIKLKKAPEGSLVIAKRGKRIQYYYRRNPSDKLGTYLDASQKPLIQALAQKSYHEKVLKTALAENKVIADFLRKLPVLSPEQVYEEIPELRRFLISPIIETDDTFITNWISLDYPRKPVNDGSSAFQMPNGEFVRSKSEFIIASLLTRENIPFRYECPLRLSTPGVIHPDFTVLNVRLRKELYWEHLGMMDDPDYVEQALRRITAYQKDGFFLGDKLIITYETRNTPLSISQVSSLIDQYLK